MSVISGNVIFDNDRSATISPGDFGLNNIPIVLQDINSNLRVTTSTDINGYYSFINVPNGNYRIVESYGQTPSSTPGDFASATSGSIPLGVDPPLSIVPSPPTGSTNLDSLSPNTLFVTITGPDVTNQIFFDGPFIYTPITSILDPCAIISPTNLITAANSGNFGFFPAGTPADTGEPTNPPYPGVTPGFTYALPNPLINTPIDGEYTIQNILSNNKLANANRWWRISDHTTGNETGRLMAINGSNPGAIFFQQTISVTPNTNYLFSSWILNLIRFLGDAIPALGVQILDINNNILYNQILGNSIPARTVVPEWKQIGTVLNSGNNNQLIVKFISQGPSAEGNDYAIDDISLQAISFPVFTPVKSVTPSFISLNQVATYTVTLTNGCQSPLTSVFFKDTIPSELQFVPGSVTGGSNPVADNPNLGFNVPAIPGNSTATITFKATALSIPPTNPISNTATMNYSYTPVQGGIPNTFSEITNEVPLSINTAILNITKSVNKQFVDVGNTLTYTFTITNTGNTIANNIVLTDTIPSGLSYIAGTLTGSIPVFGTPNSGIIVSGGLLPGDTISISFLVVVNELPPINPILNTASAAFNYTIDPLIINGGSGTGTSNTASTKVNHADLISTGNFLKLGTPANINIGDTITYTLTIKNTGNSSANNVVITDPIPAGTTYVPGSVTSTATFTGDPTTSIKLTAPIAAGQSVTVTFAVKAGNSIPSTNPIPNQAAIAYAYTVNPADPNVIAVNGLSNIVNTQVSNATLITKKSADKTVSYIGNKITYNLAVTNTGNVPANQVVINDAIPNGTVYIPGSLTVSEAYTGSPITSIHLSGPINPGKTVSISFQVEVTAIPNPNPINNTATVNYAYTVNPLNPNAVDDSSTSNLATTIVFTYNFNQQLVDLIQSIALEQAALAALANSEGKKIQTMVAMNSITPQELLCLNKSVSDMLDSIAVLDSILKQKLTITTCKNNSTCI